MIIVQINTITNALLQNLVSRNSILRCHRCSLNTKARARLGILEECFIQKWLFCYSFMWLKTCDFFFCGTQREKFCAWFFFSMQVQWIQSFQTLSKKDIMYCNILKLVIHFRAFWNVSRYLHLEKMCEY